MIRFTIDLDRIDDNKLIKKLNCLFKNHNPIRINLLNDKLGGNINNCERCILHKELGCSGNDTIPCRLFISYDDL